MITVTKKAITVTIRIPLIHTYKGGGLAVFKKNGNEVSVFLGKRKNFPFKGKWTFPGGGNEGKESLFQTAVREWREETGTKILGKFVSRIGSFTIKFPLFRWKTVIIETSQNFRLNKNLLFMEFSDYEWVPLKNLARYELHPYVKKVICHYEKGNLKNYTHKKVECKKSYSKKAFDNYGMKLVRVDKDGTRYYEPTYKGQGGKK